MKKIASSSTTEQNFRVRDAALDDASDLRRVTDFTSSISLSGAQQLTPTASNTSATKIGRIIKRGVTNAKVLLGVLLEAIFSSPPRPVEAKRREPDLAADFAGLRAHRPLGEVLFSVKHVAGTRWIGVALIVAGAALVSWSEKEQTGAKRLLKQIQPRNRGAE